MNLHRIFAIFLRQVYLIRRSMGRIFGIFYWSSVELFLWGVLTVYLNHAGNAAFNFVTVFLGALIFWDFFLRAQHGIATSFLEDVWSRNFANLFATPIRAGEFLAGLILTSLAQSLLSLAFMALLAWAFLAFNIIQYGPLLIPFIAVLFMFGLALGIFTSSLILRFGSAAEILAWSIPFLFQPFSAVFYPVGALPRFLQPISKMFPATHVFEGMRSLVLQQQFDVQRLIFAAVLAVAYIGIAILVFLYTFRAAKKRGYLIHFSTESF